MCDKIVGDIDLVEDFAISLYFSSWLDDCNEIDYLWFSTANTFEWFDSVFLQTVEPKQQQTPSTIFLLARFGLISHLLYVAVDVDSRMRVHSLTTTEPSTGLCRLYL